MSTSSRSGKLFLAVPENLAPSSLGVSVHAWKRFSYLALGAMKNHPYHLTFVYKTWNM